MLRCIEGSRLCASFADWCAPMEHLMILAPGRLYVFCLLFFELDSNSFSILV